MRLLFVGAPAVGKGTQAKKLAEELGVPHISTGDILRGTASQKTDIGQKVKKYIDLGSLVPDEVMMSIIEERFRKGDTKNGYILDGFPRTTAQAMGLDMLLARLNQGITLVVLFECPDAVIMERIIERRSCPTCGAPYHLRWQKPKVEGVCDRDGTALVQRVDDTRTKVFHRLDQYRSETAAVIPYYEKRGIVRRVNANQPPDDVYREVVAVVRKG
ncbi:MAG: adenylate kinase [Planctomycetes bacterium]|nr:adenylate kinase [Planctomycetota bacterium]